MPKKKLITACFAAFICAFVSLWFLPERHNTFATGPVNTSIKQDLETLSQIRVFFGHQSVGENVLNGVRDLMSDAGISSISIVDLRNGDSLPPRGYILHTKVGENTRPDLKNADFERIIEEKKDSIDVAVLKYCFVDLTASSDPAALFSQYDALLTRLRARFPSITFVPATLPLMTSGAVPGWTRKVWEVSVRRMLNFYDVEDEDNFKRNEFNELVRRAYGGASLFDIAKVESIHPDGRVEGFQTGSSFYNSLAHEYSSDGGHLNQTGSKMAAREFVRALAAALADTSR